MPTLPEVSGPLDMQLDEHERQLLVCIGREDLKENPDRATMSALINAVRCVREYRWFASEKSAKRLEGE